MATKDEAKDKVEAAADVKGAPGNTKEASALPGSQAPSGNEAKADKDGGGRASAFEGSAEKPKDAGEVGSGFDPLESAKGDEPKKPQLVTVQAGQPVIAEDPRGDSPRQVQASGFVTHAQAGTDHPNQPVQPTRYAHQMTEWLSLPEKDRAEIAPPEPPEGQEAHPLAQQPDLSEDPGRDLGMKQVILK